MLIFWTGCHRALASQGEENAPHLCCQMIAQDEGWRPRVVLNLRDIDDARRCSPMKRQKEPFTFGSFEIAIDAREVNTSGRVIR